MSVSAISLGPQPLPLFRVMDPPVELQLVDQDGNNLPATPPARVSVSLPGYLAAPAMIANGKLPLYAKGAGIATVSVRYQDPTNGLIAASFELTVFPQQTGRYFLAWGQFGLTWGGYLLTWE